MLFVGEREEEKTGHFAYSDGITVEGQSIKSGEDIAPYESQRSVTEIERAGMHNRVLEYTAATRALFGKSANERLRSYLQLCDVLQLPMQSKIYEDVGHVGIYSSEALKKDTNRYYNGSIEGQIPTLDTQGGVSRISPIYQLMRRCLISKDRQEYIRKERQLQTISPEILLDRVNKYIRDTREISDDTNMDKIFDELTPQELEAIFFERSKQQQGVTTDNTFISAMQGQVVTDDTEYLQQVENIGHNHINAPQLNKKQEI